MLQLVLAPLYKPLLQIEGPRSSYSILYKLEASYQELLPFA